MRKAIIVHRSPNPPWLSKPNTTLSLNFSKLFANFVGRVSWNEHVEAKGQSVLESKRTVIGLSKPSGGGYSEPVQKLNTVAREILPQASSLPPA